MRVTGKPVHQCYSCLLNLGDHCWLYRHPRSQWSSGRKCPGFENEDVYFQFTEWQKQPHVKTRKELRREVFRMRKRTRVYRGLLRKGRKKW
jgi:hypothetical protein